MSNVIKLSTFLNDRDSTEKEKYEFALLRQQWMEAIEREERRQYRGENGLVGESLRGEYRKGR